MLCETILIMDGGAVVPVWVLMLDTPGAVVWVERAGAITVCGVE